MRIKKLYTYIIKTFIPLLIGSFAVAWFIVVMQLLWRFVGDIVGKGVDTIVFLRLMFYAAMTVAPLGLVLAMLVASLMTFGNLGERLELLSMRAAGIPLVRILKPLFVLSIMIGAGLFVFQNDLMITSQVKFWQYYFSIKNKSPELAIPAGVFYKEIDGYSIYVEHKDNERKMMYDMMIYEYKNGFQNATVLRADSGRLYSIKNGNVLVLELLSGESFRNLREQKSYYSTSSGLEPYMREQFDKKVVQIAFDASLNMVDEGMLSSQFVGKNMWQLSAYTDSLRIEIDSVSRVNRQTIIQRDNVMQTFAKAGRAPTTVSQTLANNEEKGERSAQASLSETPEEGSVAPPEHTPDRNPVNTFAELPVEEQARYDMAKKLSAMGMSQKRQLYETSSSVLNSRQSDIYFSNMEQDEMESLKKKNEFEYWRKVTYPVACIVFFLVGAPLGALIRKGGVGIPFVVAVFFFIIFYFLESTGIKMARSGAWEVWFGMWLPNIALGSVGILLCYIATIDANKLRMDSAANSMRKLLGTNTARNVVPRPDLSVGADYAQAEKDILALSEFAQVIKYRGNMHYIKFFLGIHRTEERHRINELIHRIISNLQHSPDILLVHRLGAYPQLEQVSKTYRPAQKWLSAVCMIVFPIGLLMYLHYRVRERVYLREIKRLLDVNQQVLGEVQRVSSHTKQTTTP